MLTRDSIVLGVLAALAMIGVVVSYITTGSVPPVLDSGTTALIGATAGVAFGGGHVTSSVVPLGTLTVATPVVAPSAPLAAPAPVTDPVLAPVAPVPAPVNVGG